MTTASIDTAATRRIAEAMYAAGTRLDLAGFLAVIAQHAQVHEPTCLPYGGTHSGHAEIQDLFGKVNELLDLTSIEVSDLVAEGDQAVASVRITARATGAELLAQERLTVRDGKVVELRVYFFDPTLAIEGPLT